MIAPVFKTEPFWFLTNAYSIHIFHATGDVFLQVVFILTMPFSYISNHWTIILSGSRLQLRIENFIYIDFSKSGRNHCCKKLVVCAGSLSMLLWYNASQFCSRLWHGRRNKPKRFAYKLSGNIKFCPGVYGYAPVIGAWIPISINTGHSGWSTRLNG